MLTKSEIQQFNKDRINFRPNSDKILTKDEILKLVFNPTLDDEVYHCCHQIRSDIQCVGLSYCGALADLIAIIDDNTIIALCERHFRRIKHEQELAYIRASFNFGLDI